MQCAVVGINFSDNMSEALTQQNRHNSQESNNKTEITPERNKRCLMS